MRAYVSGPMSGHVDHNHPAFHEATKYLRRREGAYVVNPAEMDEELTQEELDSMTWEDFLRRDLSILFDPEQALDTVVLLPGWQESRGATLEASVARDLGFSILEIGNIEGVAHDYYLRPVSPTYSYRNLAESSGNYTSEKPDTSDHSEVSPESDNPTLRTFDTGATRDLDDSKHDYEGFLSPLVIRRFGEYMHGHRLQKDGTVRDSDNWQKGIPLDAYVKSMFRHFMDVWELHRGYEVRDFEGEPVDMETALSALLFNVQGYLHELLREKDPVGPDFHWDEPLKWGGNYFNWNQ